ncbi:copper amine oxidase [Paenibacillus sp. IHBB 10380]|nr:copper amine oxidase [Paenibacillus sp. IHBB 10380]
MGMRGRRALRILRIWVCSVLGILVLLTSMALPVFADQSHKQELKLRVGSSKASINGEQLSIAKPYSSHGITMVPVGVFKKAFGSQIRLEKENIVKVLNGPHTLVMTIDEHIAWIDGKKSKLTTAPTMVSGTLMVPLRLVAQGIGAKVSSSADGTLSISLETKQNAANPDVSGIDSDVGKTKIGNSFYEWTINYPTELIIGSGGEYENIATFSDAEEAYYVEVHADKQDVELEADDLMQQLVEEAKSAGEVILDRETFPNAKVPYASIILKDSDDILWECRAYYHNERLYEVYLADLHASNYKDLSKYSAFLNSFKPEFNKNDVTVKDLSNVIDGMRSVYNNDYGITLNVPAEWSMNNSSMYYTSEEGSYLKLNVSSVPKDSTLEEWSTQMKKWMEESFVTESYKIVDTYPIQLSGNKALVNEVKYNYGDGWVTEYEVMLQKDGFRYYVEYSVPDDQIADLNKFKDIIKSIEIEYEVVSETYGRMEQDTYLIDKLKTITKSSKAFQYKINIPQYWTAYEDRFEYSPVEYEFTGGRFMITVEKDSSVEAAVNQLKAYYNEAIKNQKDLKIQSTENTTFAGVPATMIKLHQIKDGIPYTGSQIIFGNQGVTYTITTSLNDSNATELQKSILESTLKSFVLNKQFN